jgi:hypothetical protein
MAPGFHSRCSSILLHVNRLAVRIQGARHAHLFAFELLHQLLMVNVPRLAAGVLQNELVAALRNRADEGLILGALGIRLRLVGRLSRWRLLLAGFLLLARLLLGDYASASQHHAHQHGRRKKQPRGAQILCHQNLHVRKRSP